MYLAVAAALLLVACSPASSPATSDGGEDEAEACLLCGDATDDASLAVQVKGRIDEICSNSDGCHGDGVGHMGLMLGNEFAPMIDVTSFENPPMLRVKPGDPAQSYVYLKLACDGGIEGGCMPLSSGFDPTLANLFHDWIEAGAPLP